MATDFPGGLQDFSVVATGNNITASNHNTIQDTIEALEAKVGITSSGESSSIDYLIKSTSSKLGKIASLTVSGNYIVGDGALVGANWGVKSPSEVVTDLGLVIGTDVQAYSNKLDSLTSTVPAAADKYIQYDSGNYAGITTVEVRADLFTLGSDATGDVFYRDASGILARLGVGTADDVLTLAGDPVLPTWAEAAGGSSAFTDPVTITADDADPLLIITQSASNTGLLQLAQGAHTLTWTKSGNSFQLSHSSGSASIKLQDNSEVTMGGVLGMGTATAAGIGFKSHGGIYGYGGSRIHVYPQSGQPLIIGSNTSSQTGLKVFFEAIPVNFLVNTSIAVTDTDPALTIDQAGTGDALQMLEDGDERIGYVVDGSAEIHLNRGAGVTGDYDFNITQEAGHLPAYIKLGGTTKIQFAAAGINITGTINATTDIHATGVMSQNGTGENEFRGSFKLYKQLTALADIRWHGHDSAYANYQYANLRNVYEVTTVAADVSTDTGIDIPAKCIVFGVSVRVTTAIPTATTFSVGVAGDTDRYGSGISTAIDTTNPGVSNVYSYHEAAEKVVITPNSTPGTADGRLRLDVWLLDITPPTG